MTGRLIMGHVERAAVGTRTAACCLSSPVKRLTEQKAAEPRMFVREQLGAAVTSTNSNT